METETITSPKLFKMKDKQVIKDLKPFVNKEQLQNLKRRLQQQW